MTICLLMCSRKRKSRSGPSKAPNLPNGLWQLKAHIAYEYYIIMYFYLLPYYFIYLEVQKQVLYICFSHSVLMSFYHKGHHHLICLALFSWFWKLEESCWLKPISHSSQIFMQKSFLLPASRQDVFGAARQKAKEKGTKKETLSWHLLLECSQLFTRGACFYLHAIWHFSHVYHVKGAP